MKRVYVDENGYVDNVSLEGMTAYFELGRANCSLLTAHYYKGFYMKKTQIVLTLVLAVSLLVISCRSSPPPAQVQQQQVLPDSATASRELADSGETHLWAGRLDAAIRDLNEAISLDPNNYLAFGLRGITHNHLRQFDASVRDLNESIRLSPNNAMFFFFRGQSHFMMEQDEAAVRDFNEAIRLHPNYELFYYHRGRLHFLIGKPTVIFFLSNFRFKCPEQLASC